MAAVFFIAGFVLVLLEAGIVSMPLFFAFIIAVAVFYQSRFVYFLTAAGGILLDELTFRTVGVSSIFFLGVLLLIFLYEQKFTIKTPQFVFTVTALMSAIYLWYAGYHAILLQAIGTAVIAVLFFEIIYLTAKLPRRKVKEKTGVLPNSW